MIRGRPSRRPPGGGGAWWKGADCLRKRNGCECTLDWIMNLYFLEKERMKFRNKFILSKFEWLTIFCQRCLEAYNKFLILAFAWVETVYLYRVIFHSCSVFFFCYKCLFRIHVRLTCMVQRLDLTEFQVHYRIFTYVMLNIEVLKLFAGNKLNVVASCS